MKIAVVGTGYVGLVTGTCFAETGNDVICVDIDQSKVDKLNNGQLTIYEPGLQLIFDRNTKNKRLSFTTSLADAVKDAVIIFLALPTPPGEDGSADLSYILGVAKELGSIITDYKVIVDKSTVPVGTSELVTKTLKAETNIPFDVVSNPEFLKEGVAVDDFLKPDRVVIGTSSPKAQSVMEKLYAPFVRQGNPVIFMDEKSAEMTKYAANSYLATRITFMNEIANLCEKVGADVDNVRRGIGSDGRIGNRFLFAGVGYGGSCFPKDVSALVKTAQKNDYDFKVLKSVMEVNDNQKQVLSRKIIAHYGGNLKGKTIAVWGLSFKPNTDDVREAPAKYIIKDLLEAGAKIQAFDPEAADNFKGFFNENEVTYVDNQYKALENADALAIITEWSAFRQPNFDKISNLLSEKTIFDGRNLYSLDQMAELGFYYDSIGRGVINPS